MVRRVRAPSTLRSSWSLLPLRLLTHGSNRSSNGPPAFPEQQLPDFQLHAVARAARKAAQDLFCFRQAAHQGPNEHLVSPFGSEEVRRDLAQRMIAGGERFVMGPGRIQGEHRDGKAAIVGGTDHRTD